MLGFVRIYWDFLGYAEICWDVLGFGGFCWDLLGFVGACWDLSGFAGIYWDLLEDALSVSFAESGLWAPDGKNWLKWVSLTIFLLVSLFNHILSHFGPIVGRFLVDF